MNSTSDAIVALIAAGFVILIVSRQFWLWFFGVRRIIRVLESIDASLQYLPAVQHGRSYAAKQQKAA